jgi:hypothetical protein
MTNTEIYLVEPEERTSPFPPTFMERNLESLKEIASKLLCVMFQKHSWLIEIREWEYSEISSLSDYRTKRASNLKCRHCNKCQHVKDAKLDHYETVCYNWQTSVYYEYIFLANNYL